MYAQERFLIALKRLAEAKDSFAAEKLPQAREMAELLEVVVVRGVELHDEMTGKHG